MQGGGFSWLFSFQNGAPPLGWHDTICYLVLPVGLVVSQYVTQKVLTPSSSQTDPSQQQSQAILKFLPLMIGACWAHRYLASPCRAKQTLVVVRAWQAVVPLQP